MMPIIECSRVGFIENIMFIKEITAKLYKQIQLHYIICLYLVILLFTQSLDFAIESRELFLTNASQLMLTGRHN